MQLVGIDLAWMGERNSSGLACGVIQSNRLHVTEMHSGVLGLRAIKNILERQHHMVGVAIDGPLIIRNASGSRAAEKALSKRYAKHWASCHPSNLKLHPNAISVKLSEWLLDRGIKHLGNPAVQRWQVECYPHPALIELFSLQKRLAYKKGRVLKKKSGQMQLAEMLLSLNFNRQLRLVIPEKYQVMFDPFYISELKGAALKKNEDALDAVVCLYIAGLYAIGQTFHVFGDVEEGYIVVPYFDTLDA
ncbi:DUF429 domain-containing protein [Marinicella sp. W31]|uniref:DUF429 domain-containing protein n=1 Tax=Marinicella sp. W31 TaxID=3023713 RepID=UPI0037582367